MNTRGHSGKNRVTAGAEWRGFRLAPITQAIAVVLATGGVMGDAYAARAFSPSWFAGKGSVQETAIATGRLSDGTPVSSLNPQAQQQKANAQLQQSIANLGLAAQGIAAQQAAQAAMRQAAKNGASVPDGLTEGGLKIDTDSLTAGWVNANQPVQTQAGGNTNVAIQQTADKAILNWETFNVGKNTTVQFQQQPDWAVLNRINDPQMRPSQIQGQVKGDGTVMIANRNGVIFSGSSQVNARNLVVAAATINDAQFTTKGLYGGDLPSFTDANGKVDIQGGAQITTNEPTSVTQGGGYVLLLGKEVGNAGEITTRRGQAQLAAGDSFIIRKGVGTEGNTASTTRGNEVSPQFNADSAAGTASNTGLILAREGDITLAGRQVHQDGVAVSTTTVNVRGTIHLLNSATDALGQVTLDKNAITAIVIEDDGTTTALDSQRDALIKDSAQQDPLRAASSSGVFDNLSLLSDRRDLSRIEIVSGGDVQFEGNSLTLATGGQIAVSTGNMNSVANGTGAAQGGRIQVGDGAQLDVSGAVGVQVAMASNSVSINIQGNEQRDAPVNRDTGNLNNANVWIDTRRLTYVPAGTGGYASDRWYTEGGLLEVGGYLGNVGHTVGQWDTLGGRITLASNEVVAQSGSVLNISGGTENVQAGFVRMSWLKGVDGRLYEVSTAPAEVAYVGVYQGFEDVHPRWGDSATSNFNSPLIAPQQRFEDGYTVGRDAGSLILSTPTAVIDGDVVAEAFNGSRQTDARPANVVDGYKLSQDFLALPGSLVLGTPQVIGPIFPVASSVTFSNEERPADATGTSWFNVDKINGYGLGGITVFSSKPIVVADDLVFADGAQVSLTGSTVDMTGSIAAHGGNVLLEGGPGVTLHSGAVVDTSGRWTNALLDPAGALAPIFINGGSVTLRAAGDVILEAGSLINTSAGGAITQKGKAVGGAGGDIALIAGFDVGNGVTTGNLTLDGDLQSYGFTHGGALTLRTSGAVIIGDDQFSVDQVLQAGVASPLNLVLKEDVTIAAGTPLPLPYQVLQTHSTPGESLTQAQAGYLPFGSVVKLAADWVVDILGQIGWYMYDSSGAPIASGYANPGDTIPKGAVLDPNYYYYAGMVLPANVFPDGIPLNTPIKINHPAGFIASNDVTYAAGTVIPAGIALPEAAAVNPVNLLKLAPEFFSRGFSNYSINGAGGLIVGADAQIDVTMPVLQFTADNLRTPSGASVRDAANLVLTPTYFEDPVRGMLTQRQGADIALHSDNPSDGIGGSISIGKGSEISVDPGYSVTLTGGQVTVDGKITAHGGTINVLNNGLFNLLGSDVRDPIAMSVWIGDGAVLDASGQAYTALDRKGRAYGVVPDGGAITLGSLGGENPDTHGANAASAFIIVRPGALIDASGASASIDLDAGRAPTFTSATADPEGARLVSSNGGSITMRSYYGIYNDGTLRAAARGPGAAGGTLSLVLETPTYPNFNEADVPEALRAGRVLTVSDAYVPSGLADDLQPGEIDPKLFAGQTVISASQITDGGFDNVSLWGRTAIVFDGDVSLHAGQSISLLRGPIYDTVEGASVSLNAPYIRLEGQTAINMPPNARTMYVPAELGVYPTGGTFQANADLIDVQNVVRTNFAQTNLTSAGDMRFLAASDIPNAGSPTTVLAALGNLDLAAEQLYPTTSALVNIYAGVASLDDRNLPTFSPDHVLAVHSVDGVDPALPYSVFGSITLAADTVLQGGIVRAPLGAISLGVSVSNGQGIDGTLLTELLPGSITSVSAAGLAMPYGGTVDGITYSVNGGAAVTPDLVLGSLSGNIPTAQPQSAGVYLNGVQVVGDAGSLIDVSGGGALLGAAFVQGRGGSVDVLTTSLVNANPVNAALGSSGGQVYAIVPGVVVAPVAGGYNSAWTGDVPGIGQQFTLSEGVPGLPAGTYTLLPANYALLPNAFRIELGGHAAHPLADTVSLPNGSYAVSGIQGVANTSIKDALATSAIITPGAAIRRYSNYNEQGYDAFQRSQAGTFGTVRSMLPSDGKFLTVNLNPLDAAQAPTTVPALVFEGSANFAPATADAYGGSLVLTFTGGLRITGPDGDMTRTDLVTPVKATAITNIGAPNLYIGAAPRLFADNGGAPYIDFGNAYNDVTNYTSIEMEKGAVLTGSQVVLVTARTANATISLDTGAQINTLGRGISAIDSTAGYFFGPPTEDFYSAALLIVSNGQIALNAPSGRYTSAIDIADGAALYSEGSIGFYADKGVSFHGSPQLGTRNLSLAVSSFNVGSSEELAAAALAGTLPRGINFDQAFLDRLLNGDRASGAPAIENLILSASQSINFYGSVDIDARGSADSQLDQLVLNSPAIYGYGTAEDVVNLSANTLIWNGNVLPVVVNGRVSNASASPGAIIPNGPGTGAGTFNVNATKVVIGYPELSQPAHDLSLDRLLLGFGNVHFTASDSITANGSGTLSVYQSGPDPSVAFDPDTYAGIGGNLTLDTPLFTADSGGMISYHVGGALKILSSSASVGTTRTPAALGGEIDLYADSIVLSSAIVLRSGKLAMTTNGDITLAAGSTIDLSGQATPFFDVTKYTWGGDAALESAHGNIVQAAGSVIDVSAVNNDAGTITLTAIDDNAGRVQLDGVLRGNGGDGFDGGSIDMRVQRIGVDLANLSTDFATLNALLNAGGFFNARTFDLKQGGLTVGDEVHAHDVEISTDGGSLAVTGTIDATGAAPGTIRLAAHDDLTLASTAVLDTHGKVLQIDSYGQAIEAKNRGSIELTSVAGRLTLSPGATMDLSAPDGVNRGTVQLNAARTGETSGDIQIVAAGPIAIRGAGNVAVNGMWSYSPTDADGTIKQDNGSTDPVSLIDGSVGLNQIDQRNVQFIDAALLNGDLQGRLAGLSAYGPAFHLRPGVEINSEDTPSGNLTVVGDLDLSGFRYGPGAVRDVSSAAYGAGESGVLLIRASGNLKIGGSINDGFSPPDEATFNRPDVIAAGTPLPQTFNPQTPMLLTADWVVPPGGSTYDYPNGSQFYTEGMTVPAGTTLYPGYTVIPAGFPFSQDLAIDKTVQGRLWAVAPMQAPGTQSWSMRLASGADLSAADTRRLDSKTHLAGAGNLSLSDVHSDTASGAPIFSVVRTGTGDLDLLAGGNISEASLYGIYTAGTQTVAPNGAAPPENTYYPDHGGNLLVAAQGSVSGFLNEDYSTAYKNSSNIANWLAKSAGVDGSGGWSINFGHYVSFYDYSIFQDVTLPVGFIGFGALGGGNVTILAGGDAGNVGPQDPTSSVTQGLVVAVGSTGLVTSVDKNGSIVVGGDIVQTGGGDIKVKIGRLNPASVGVGNSTGTDAGNGTFVDPRGDISIDAQSIGRIPLVYGTKEPGDPRAADPYAASSIASGAAWGGPIIVPGDGVASVRTRGDLAIGGVGNPGFVTDNNDGTTTFSLWQPATAISLFSAGGDLMPYNAGQATNNEFNYNGFGLNIFFLPATFEAVAARGSIYSGVGFSGSFELAPSPSGQLQLLATDNVFGSAFLQAGGRWNVSGADSSLDAMANPFKAFVSTTDRDLSQFGHAAVADNLHKDDTNPIRIYAVDGDIVDFILGEEIDDPFLGKIYLAAKTAQVRAGRDIVNFGNARDTSLSPLSSGLIMNANDSDVSVISAGRDMFYTNVMIAGPGTLDISAGRNLYQADQGIITSIGPIVPGDERAGAGIVMLAGSGAQGPDYADFAKLYFDPASQLPDGTPLDGSGKVAKTYDEDLLAWLQQRFGYTGSKADALAYFLALPPEQQGIFARQVFFAELDAGGKEFNDPDSKRFQSYLRGRNAIATLFPDHDAQGDSIDYRGAITMFGNSGVHTQFGGSIQTLTPGGQTLVGVEGANPPGTAGVVTQGDGDIDMYSLGSILLGQSRVMTTFGGNVLAWSATGDINAGRGAKTTVVYTPPRRVYDDYGNVMLSPDVPSSGAGFATLAPIPEVPPGDMNLVAPLGTIDAGEAGIRVSGNVNLVALQVVNAANIQVQGKAVGIPTVAAVNVGALTNASAAAAQATLAAQDVVHQQQAAARQALPSIFTVRVLGFGNEPVERDKAAPLSTSSAQPAPRGVRYRQASPLQFVGVGQDFDPALMAQLSASEQQQLLHDR